MSYSIDVYRKKIEPTKDFIAFAAFVSFFPQLVAGPIERAANLLPQFYRKRIFEYSQAADGCKQILWGLFKKSVVADNCALYVDTVFNNFNEYRGSTLLLGAVLFSFQIYGDFSGYSDIAIGTSKLFGFTLMRNFAFPYFSRDIAEFWRRWHISLNAWFRDYVYIPLGGSRSGVKAGIRNTFIIFVLSGFWHGANWTFIVWGMLHAVYFLPLLLLRRNRIHIEIAAAGKKLPGVKEFLSIVTTFGLTVFAWIFFRAGTMEQALRFIAGIFSKSTLTAPELNITESGFVTGSICISVLMLLFIEWINRAEEYGFKRQIKNKFLKWPAYIIIALVIIELGGTNQGFIYFQF
jgi:D-alanyl-lipoteichoic acid acyltransferase DltB (MBOAT superfamily)